MVLRRQLSNFLGLLTLILLRIFTVKRFLLFARLIQVLLSPFLLKCGLRRKVIFWLFIG